MTKEVRDFIKTMGRKYWSYESIITDKNLPKEVRDYFDKLEDDIIRAAMEGMVYVFDCNSEMAEGYEIESMEDYLEYCVLPESVREFALISMCDWEYIFDMFISAEKYNVVPSFQFAEGKIYCNFSMQYRYMTFDYKMFRSIMNSDITDIAYAYEIPVRELIFSRDLFVYGNKLGKKYFDVYLEEIETEYENNGIENIVDLYKKSLCIIKEKIINYDSLSVGSGQSHYYREYELQKRNLVVDILSMVNEKGISIYDMDMPDTVNRFIELSGCENREIVDIYRIAAEEAEKYNIAYMQFGDDTIVLVKDYDEARKLLDSICFEGVNTDCSNNCLGEDYMIRYLAEKSGKTKEDYWNYMMDILHALAEVGAGGKEAVEAVLKTTAGIIYVALVSSLQGDNRYYHRDIYGISCELKNIYRKMIE